MVQHIFLLNNYHYIMESIITTGLEALVEAKLLQQFRSGKSRHQENYIRTYVTALLFSCVRAFFPNTLEQVG